MAELFIPYADPQPFQGWRNAFDIGEYGIGIMANSLELGCGCLGEIRYLDVDLVGGGGEPYTIRRAICLHEEDFGLLWKHFDPTLQTTETRRSRRFSGWDTGILVNEETADAREKPGQSVVTSVIVLALMYAFLTFALQGAVHTKDLESNGSNALSYIAQVVSGSALAKYMILAVALSALGSTLASLVSGVRVTFSMGSDGVLPRQFAITTSRFKTPVLATIVIGVIAAIGVWLYTFGSSTVQNSFTTIVSVDGLLFALYYALTGIATMVYYRKLAVRGTWSFVQLAIFPLAASAFLVYIIYRSVATLGGWSGKNLVSLYVMLGIGAVIMLYVRFRGASDYFSMPRETYQPEAEIPAAGSKTP